MCNFSQVGYKMHHNSIMMVMDRLDGIIVVYEICTTGLNIFWSSSYPFHNGKMYFINIFCRHTFVRQCSETNIEVIGFSFSSETWKHNLQSYKDSISEWDSTHGVIIIVVCVKSLTYMRLCNLFDCELRFARSPRNYFAVVNFLFPIRSNFGVFRHLLVLDKFRHVWDKYNLSNRIIISWEVWTCL